MGWAPTKKREVKTQKTPPIYVGGVFENSFKTYLLFPQRRDRYDHEHHEGRCGKYVLVVVCVHYGN